MINIEQFQQRRKEHVDAACLAPGSVSKGVQDTVAAYAGYSRRSFEEGNRYFEKLARVKPGCQASISGELTNF